MRTIRLFGLLLFMGLFFMACGSDDNDPSETDPIAQPDPDTDPDSDAGLPSGWLTGYFSDSPQGRLYYMEANENIPNQTDVSNAVELGFGARITSFGENPYSWNDDAGTITKWNVDRSTLEFSVEGIISFASLGISGNIGLDIRFVSETKAYVPFIAEGLIVEFSPSAMEITEVINFDFPFAEPVNAFYFTNEPVFIPETEKIIYGISYFPTGCCEYDGPNGFPIAVLDTRTNTVEFKQDPRLLSAESLIRGEDGNIYINPGLGHSLAMEYMDNLPPGAPTELNVLRLDQDGNFDPDFSFDLQSALPTQFARAFEVPSSGNKIPFIYADSTVSSFDESFNDRFTIFDNFDDWPVVTVDFITGEVAPSDFDQYEYIGFPHTTNGVNYAVIGTFDPDAETGSSNIVRLESGFNLTLLTEHPNGAMQRLAQLW
ncbi:MAG: hypothetical protein AAF554_08920 [Bacteroidota bacterium]